MKRKWPDAKVLFLALILAVGGYWLFVAKSRFKESPLTIKQKLYGLKNRTVRALRQTDSVALGKECNEVLCLNDTIYLTPYDVLSDKFQYYRLEKGRLREVRLTDKATICQSMNRHKDGVVFLLRHEDDSPVEQSVSSVYIRSNKGGMPGGELDLPCEYTSQADDSCFYEVNKKAGTTFLYKYNYHLKMLADSLNLNKVLGNASPHLDYILSGRITVAGSKLIFKSMYASDGIIMDRYDLARYTTFKTIDSLPLPDFKQVELADGVTQFQLEPEIMVTWRLKAHNNGMTCLSALDYDYMSGQSKVKNSFLDIYDSDMRYAYSLKLPPHKGHLAYSSDYDPDLKTLYVLYDDYKTLLKFRVQ